MVGLMGGTAHAASASFKDWTAVCDNVRHCVAFGFAPEDQETQGFLKLDRAGGAEAAPQLSVALNGEQIGDKPWSFLVDGKPVPGLSGLRPKAADDLGYARVVLDARQGAALTAAVATGSALTVDAGGVSASVSLAGSSATLRWIDDRQKRAGTVTAMVAKGPQPATQVPALPAPPLVIAGKVPPQTGVGDILPKSVRAKFPEDCESQIPKDMRDPISARLAPGVILWGDVCATAAYQSAYSLFLADEKGANVRLAPLEDGQGGLVEQPLIGVSFDLDSLTLSSFYKGRGLADCGGSQTWVWDGKQFRLTDETFMDLCRGVPPDEWPAAYVSRSK